MAEQANNNLYGELKKNDRYFLAILASFILSLLLLFHKDLDKWIQRRFIPAYVVYILGAALLAQIQNMTGIRRRRQLEAENKHFTGTYAPIFLDNCCIAYSLVCGVGILFNL